MNCSKCAAESSSGSKFCMKCGAPLLVEPAPQANFAGQGTMRGLGAASGSPQRRASAGGTSKWIALLCSFFFPGLGQLYNGDTKKGFTFLGAGVVGLVSFAAFGGLITLVAWIWSMIDGYRVAKGTGKRW